MASRQLPLIARLIREHRINAGLSQEGLAEQSGVSVRAISDLERGLRATPRLETVRMLADSLPIDSDDRAALFTAARPHPSPSDDISEPPGSGGSRPTMLPLRLQSVPAVLTHLVGQDDLIALTVSLALDDEHRLITLVGPGGVGKTHLCTEVAQRVAGTFIDGVAFVDLSALQQPDLVPSAIGAAVGLDSGGGTSAIQSVSDALRHRNLLLVLDNFEHLLAAAPMISELLAACPSLTMLVTSRVRLRVRGEQVVPVAPLSVPPAKIDAWDDVQHYPAVQLFLDRARAADAGFSIDHYQLPTIAEICRRLDGLPLAIELAASRISVYSPESLLARLDRLLPALTGGRRDAPERQQTLASTIRWSYELLDGHVQRMLRRLAIFSGGWTLEAAERVATEPGEDAASMIEVLVDHSLIKLSRPATLSERFTMLDTVREFAEAALLASGEADITRRRHREWCLELATRAGQEFILNINDQLWYTTLDAELANMRSALAFMRENSDISGVLHLIRDTLFFWMDRPYYRDISQWLDWAMEQEPVESQEFMARIQGTRAFLAASLGDHERARSLVKSMHRLVDEVPTPEVRCRAYQAQGVCIEYAGDIEASAAAYLLAMDTCKAAGALHDVMQCQRELADKWILIGRVPEAVALLDECLSFARSENAGTQVAHALGARALAALAQRDVVLAACLFTEYLDLSQAYRMDRDALGAIAGIAALALAIEQPVTAAQLLGAVESARQSIGIARIFNQLHAERTMVELHASLGPDSLAAAITEGASMTYDDAVATAREVAATARDTNE
ncbi:MAG: helix-turn-helix domain-containing protein [Thermomicrobiales bacterium]